MKEKKIPQKNIIKKKLKFLSMDYTVQTVSSDLRQGEQISKKQNFMCRKSTLQVLHQLRSKGGGGLGAGTCGTRPALGPTQLLRDKLD